MRAIHLLPVGDTDRRLVDQLARALHETLRMPVRVASATVPLEQFFDPARGQYNSTAILLHLKGRLTTGVDKYLVVVQEDLFMPILTYVFGEAELGGNLAVASYHRLQNEVYGLPPNPSLLLERLTKEALHELGHTFGLVHCHSLQCVMHTSMGVEEVDLKGGDFCNECRATIEL